MTGVMVVEKENERSIFSGRDQVHRQDAAKIGDPTFQNDQIDVAMGTDATSMHGGTVALTVEMLSSCKWRFNGTALESGVDEAPLRLVVNTKSFLDGLKG